MRKHLLLIAALFTLAACNPTTPPSGVSGVPQSDANKLNAEHSRFEQSEDPPFTAQTHFAAGQLAESQNRPDKAIEQYQAALKLDATHQPSLYRMAVVYTQTRDYSHAIETWKTYLKLTNNSATAYSNLGFCYELAGRAPDAEAAYKEGLTRDAASEPCHVNYGLLLARLGRINEATAQLQAVLPPAQVHYNLAAVFEQQGKRDQARAEYRQALQLDPNTPGAKQRLDALDKPPTSRPVG